MHRIRKIKNLKKIIIWIVAAAVIAGAAGGFIIRLKNKAAGSKDTAALSTVTRGDVEMTITGSGTVEPYERYEIIPLVNGEITDCPYEVGDYVEKGEVIYSFDMSDALINLEKQNNSMQKSTITYNEAMENAKKLTVTAASSGRITSLNVAAGDEISSNEIIAVIKDDVNLSVKLPFNRDQIAYIKKGSTATLSSSTQMSNFTGTVSYVDTTPSAAADGSSVYYVTVDFTNPGAVADGTNLGAQINGQISPGYGTVTFGEEKQIKAETDGRISKLYIAEGAYVSKGQMIASISSETMENAMQKSKLEYEDAKLSLQSQQDALEDYNITAPISGTVLTKTSKAGDVIDRTNSSVTMMVIGDVSRLKFSLSIDELDVSKVSIGQKVKITSDAVEGQEFEGEITSISMEGTASNGVTTYDAEVTINEPGELKPSMNVDAVVVIDSVSNVLRVPSSDVITAMGHSFVYVKDDGTVKAAESAKAPEDNSQRGGNRPQRKSESGEMPEVAEAGESAPNRNEAPSDAKAPGSEGESSRQPKAPEGFITVAVETGLEGDDYTEIISGLREGQQIYQQETGSSSANGFGGMGRGPGGMGGGMPGGMGGGMPGGGGMGPR
ncbi:MAG: HlyD family efflux transporter periplasmic adaptor subunit [Clostridia bacterium]|nr:HlyD family efflux transporter periplasmic adaptor subunit [Clostridia bacterium]